MRQRFENAGIYCLAVGPFVRIAKTYVHRLQDATSYPFKIVAMHGSGEGDFMQKTSLAVIWFAKNWHDWHKVVPEMLASSAASMPIVTFLILAWGMEWLTPGAAMSKRLAGPLVYVGSVTSNRFPVPSNQTCAPSDFACTDSGQEGSAPRDVKLSFADVLRTRGLTVSATTPRQGRYYEVALFAKVYEQITPLAFPKQFACDLHGMVIRRGEPPETRKEVEVHKLDLGGLDTRISQSPGDLASRLLVTSCLEKGAATVHQVILKMNKS